MNCQTSDRVFRILLLAAIYCATGILGLKLHSVNNLATFIWAPTGISLAFLLIYGRRLWPGVALGAFLVNYLIGKEVLPALIIATGNTLEALLSSSLLKSVPEFQLPMRRLRCAVRLIFLAIPLAAVVSASFGAIALELIGKGASFFSDETWMTWWMGNTSGALLITPLALCWYGVRVRQPPPRRLLEATALSLGLLLITGLIFYSKFDNPRPAYPLNYVLFTFIIWASLRFSLPGMTASSFIIALLALGGTVLHRGPYGGLILTQSLYYLDSFLAIAAASGLLLASAIQERKTAHESEASKRALQEFIDNLSDFSAKVSLDETLLILNRKAIQASGLTAQELAKTNFMNGPWLGSDPAVRARVRNAFERATQGESISYEERLTHPGPETVPVQLKMTPVHASESGENYIVVEAQDLTKQKTAEERLRKSETMLSEAQKITHIGSWEWEIDTNRIAWSAEMYRIYGIDPAEFTGTLDDFLNRVHPDDRSRIMRQVGDCRETGLCFHEEERIMRPGGEIRILESRAAGLKDFHGRVIRLTGTCQDVTERKAIERERADLLTREMKARQEAEANNRAKDVFLATLSHELRTPLTTILSWAQILQLKNLDPSKVQRGHAMIEQSAKTQLQMINDLLDISRIIMGKLALQLEPVDPRPEIQMAFESIRHQADEKGLEVEMAFGKFPGLISADPTRLRQIFWNLLTNAIRFTPTGGKIRIVGERISPNGEEWLRIAVQDTGKGISPDFLPRLFNPFIQADGSSTRIHGGLGMGLSIVRRLVELHHGKVSAFSEGPGKGATFLVELPLLRAAAQDARRSPDEIRPPAGKILPDDWKLPLQGRKILLIDDDPGANEAVGESLKALGAEVQTAASASQGLRLLDEYDPEILISDLAMPEEDGYSLIRRIRHSTDSHHPRTPAIALSAYAAAEDREKALTEGFQAYLSKPVDMEILADTINRVLKSGGSLRKTG